MILTSIKKRIRIKKNGRIQIANPSNNCPICCKLDSCNSLVRFRNVATLQLESTDVRINLFDNTNMFAFS